MIGALSRLVVRAGWLLIPLWIAGAVLATTKLPSVAESDDSPVGAFIPRGSTALATEREEARLFGTTIISRVAVVQHAANGLSDDTRRRALRRALAIFRGENPAFRNVKFALPLTSDTTILTYLYFAPETKPGARRALAQSYANSIRREPGQLVGVTGVLPARLAEADEIGRALPKLTAATVALVALILLFVFRAPGPPLLTLVAAGIAYTVASHVAPWVGQQIGHTTPRDVEPILVALVLGLVTDYSIFFLHGMRRRLAEGESRVSAAHAVTALNFPIVLTAGLIVALGALTLVVGELEVFRAFGPGMAVTVVISLAVALTFVPAAMRLLGPALFWPSRGGERDREREREDETAWRSLTKRPVAFVLAAVATLLLAGATYAATDLKLGVSLLRGQPETAEVKLAAEAAQAGFATGILSPTELLLQGSGMNARRQSLAKLQAALELEPGVARVVGAAQQPKGVKLPVFVTSEGHAARLAIVLDEEPLNTRAIDVLDRLQSRLPALLRQSGLDDVRAGWAGDTALSQESVQLVRDDSLRVGGAVMIVNFVLLALFLRALAAPLFLLAASALALGAALGISTLILQGVLGHDDLTYYVPFAAAVMLLSLGSDYNVFVAGRIRQESEEHPVREAVARAAPRASGAITAAGVTLAASFAMLAIVPIRPMRELALVMAIGILLDTFVVRSVLVPAVIALLGRYAWWPANAVGSSSAAATDLAGAARDR